MKKTKVLYVTTSTNVGGAEKTLFLLASRLDRRQFEVPEVVCLKPLGPYAEKLKQAAIPVETLSMNWIPTPMDFLALLEKLQAARPQIVHAFLYRAIQLCRLAKSVGRLSFKLVSSPRVHYRSRAPVLRWLDRSVKNQDDLMVSESMASRKYVLESMGYAAAKVTTIYNGVEAGAWSRSQQGRADIRSRFGVADGDVLLGCVGRFHEQKGQRHLIRAVKSLADRKAAVKCLFIGDGPDRARMQEKVARWGLSERIFFAGEQMDMRLWLSAMDIFVLPSLWEGTPNVVMEAMVMRLPVIATRVDGVQELIRHGETGWLVSPADPKAIVKAVENLILQPTLAQAAGHRARAYAERHFDVGRMVKEYEKAYLSLSS
ncbi:MAG: glycosyltransferase [Elusimicrobia bacterium]|nr:glycosyltransferase [Elusimicrobiota bacterium]